MMMDPNNYYFTKYKPNNVQDDANALRKAMRGFGTDEAAIIEIIANRSSNQRQDIKFYYKQSFGRDLIEDLKDELGGDFETASVALFYTQSEYHTIMFYNPHCKLLSVIKRSKAIL